MNLNKQHWNLWKLSEEGKAAIELFEKAGNGNAVVELFEKHFAASDAIEATEYVSDLLELTTKPIFPEELPDDQAGDFFGTIVDEGILMTYEDGELEISDISDLLFDLPIISTWLYLSYPDLYKPYFFQNQFYLLTRIADAYGLELPVVPLKRYKSERLKYYWHLCHEFSKFQKENELTAAEFCAFLYDFAPENISQNDKKTFRKCHCHHKSGWLVPTKRAEILSFWITSLKVILTSGREMKIQRREIYW